MKIVFYRCRHCGNIAIKPFDSGAPLVCCGEPMDVLTANTVDAAREKHVPVVAKADGVVSVEVGSVAHPMTPDHWITFICLQSSSGYAFAPLTSEDEPKAVFSLAPGDEPQKVFEYCNLHGLWSVEL